jgi:hypothetical protein
MERDGGESERERERVETVDEIGTGRTIIERTGTIQTRTERNKTEHTFSHKGEQTQDMTN